MPWAAPVHRPAGSRTPEQRRKQADRNRGHSAARGYDTAWRKLRIEFLAQHPFCECPEHKGQSTAPLANVVDHIKPIEERPDLRLEWSNLRAMSKRCHDRRTAKEQAFGRCRKT